jgi:hypothetical protein
MDNERKSELKRDYKEQVHLRGIYCVRCLKTDALWVDSSNNLRSSENRLNFSLKTGTMLNKELQGALKDHGVDAFQFETLEVFEDDLSTYELNTQFREKRAQWQEKLSGMSLHR